MADINPGTFRLRSYDPAAVFEASFDDQAPLPTDDSYGGWQIVDIPRLMGQTEWMGRTPMGLQIDFYIDKINADPTPNQAKPVKGHPNMNAGVGDTAVRGPGEWLRAQFYKLEHMAISDNDRDEPPLLTFSSGGYCPHDSGYNPGLRWVIESLTWDRERTINNVWGNPIFLAGSIVLRQYHKDDALGRFKNPSHKNRSRNKAKAKNKNKDKRGKHAKTYTVKAGDTLISIAARILHDASRWKEIADKNNIRNPRNLKIGRVLRMP